MADKLEWAIRLVHILAAAAWVGGAILWSTLLAPRLLARGPPAIRRPIIEIIENALPAYFYAAGAITLLAGALLFGQHFGWAAIAQVLKLGEYGRMFIYAGVCGLGMLTLGATLIQPSGKKILAEMRSASPRPERLAALGKRMGMASLGTAILGILAFAAMTYAVNLVR